MYTSFYNFKEKPFTTLPNPEFLFMSKKHELALTYLEYGLSSQAGFMVLTGTIGSGKTTLLNYLIQKFDCDKIKTALILNTNISPLGFLYNILSEWDVECKSNRKAELYEKLNDFLINEYFNNRTVVLLVDEAQNIPYQTLEEIRMISNLNDEKVPLLHIILSGQPNFLNRLNNPKLEQLRQRVSVHYHLKPLDREETRLYIEHRLKKADAQDLNIFLTDAIDRIYLHSGGIPRLINLICDTALVYGYAEQIRRIDGNTVDEVVDERKKEGMDFYNHDESQESTRKSSEKNRNIPTNGSLKKKFDELQLSVDELTCLTKKMIGFYEHLKNVDRKYKTGMKILCHKIDVLGKRAARK